jgi:DnaJ-class molecular chaperone
MPEGFDPEAFARTFGGGVHVGGGGSGFGDMRGGGVDINEIFASLFGERSGRGGGMPGVEWGRSRARPSRGQDVVGDVEVTFAEAALGTRRKVQTGGGSTVEVTIPPGVETGQRLRVSGQGAPAPDKRGTPGDLYLEIRVAADRHLRRNGFDIELEVPVSVPEAALGAKVQVPTLEGPVTVTIPPGSSSGTKLRLRGRGIQKSDGTRGDQHCRIQIVVPKGVADDTELRRLFEEIGRRTAGKAVRDF